MINESLLRFFNGFHHNAHPMAMVSAVIASMSAFYHDTMDIYNPRTARSSPTASSPRSPQLLRRRTSIPRSAFVYPQTLDYCGNLQVVCGSL